MILLDTNVVSELRPGKRESSAEVRAWAAAQAIETLYLSSITLLELRVGMERKARLDGEQGRRLKAWITALEAEFEARILPFGARSAQCCAPLHVPNPREWGDAAIAATALEYGFAVATRNVRDFEHTGVRVINPWEA
ncbi:type II toxin-antitoxin system VapC family toxin [Ideonella sp.]|jgi:predicted nucleic acid-binding protein|uniref:type II toxin-antitoxin system VapC family toxin n=1 Tax=Ideonella sp. TaxID=1929293 RepID=UPI0037C014A2